MEIRLFLAEIYSGTAAVGRRVFSVSVEGSVPAAFENIDPYALAGALDRAVVVSYVHTMADDTLDLEFLHSNQNPSVKGIEILEVQ